jgi:hypothetical protein
MVLCFAGLKKRRFHSRQRTSEFRQSHRQHYHCDVAPDTTVVLACFGTSPKVTTQIHSLPLSSKFLHFQPFSALRYDVVVITLLHSLPLSSLTLFTSNLSLLSDTTLLSLLSSRLFRSLHSLSSLPTFLCAQIRRCCHHSLPLSSLTHFHSLPLTSTSAQSLHFQPCSLRYDVGTSVFDTSPKARLPAYTDRVLFLSADGDGIKATEYTSFPSIKVSDHKPVSATLHVSLCADGERIKRPYPLSPIVLKDEPRPTSVGEVVGEAVSSGRSAMGSLWKRLTSTSSVEEAHDSAGSVN